MIRTLRAFFLGRLLREKLLLVGFLALGVIMWGSDFSTRVMQFWRATNSTTNALKDQESWLRRKGEIESATQKAAAQMDPTKTLDPTNLWVTVRQLASDAGIKNFSSLGSGAAMSTGQFSINTVRVRITNTEWHDFAVFYQHLQEKAPYVAITELAMQPVRGNPSQIMASLTVASFEIRH